MHRKKKVNNLQLPFGKDDTQGEMTEISEVVTGMRNSE